MKVLVVELFFGKKKLATNIRIDIIQDYKMLFFLIVMRQASMGLWGASRRLSMCNTYLTIL